jgi:hypothetical protein
MEDVPVMDLSVFISIFYEGIYPVFFGAKRERTKTIEEYEP